MVLNFLRHHTIISFSIFNLSGGRLTFKVPKSCVRSLGSVFEALENRKLNDIEEFSFSQSTLEQVFLDFAKLQVEEGGIL